MKYHFFLVDKLNIKQRGIPIILYRKFIAAGNQLIPYRFALPLAIRESYFDQLILKLSLFKSLSNETDSLIGDALLGIQTGEELNESTPVIETKNDDLIPYVPTSYSLIGHILSQIHLSEDDIVLDYGCGKGRVLAMMALAGVKKIIGIEIEDELADQTLTNLVTIKKEYAVPAEIEVVKMDAAKYIPEDANVFYFFHPFHSQNSMIDVLKNIALSVMLNPRDIKIIYIGTYGREILDLQKDLIKTELNPFGNTSINVYSLQNFPDNHSIEPTQTKTASPQPQPSHPW